MVSIKVLKSDRITYTSQDENREFFFLFICIYTDNIALLPALIYKDNSRSLQNIWFEDWKPDKLTHFAVILNEWSCNMLRLD